MPIGQNRDYRGIVVPYNEPVWLSGRFQGNSTGALIPVPGTTKGGLVVTRLGVGGFVVTVPTPIGTYQLIDMCVLTPQTGVPKAVMVTPPTAANQVNISFSVVTANGTNTVIDLASTEELDIDIRMAASAYP